VPRTPLRLVHPDASERQLRDARIAERTEVDLQGQLLLLDRHRADGVLCFWKRLGPPVRASIALRHYSMVGWTKAVLEAGACSVALVQRFRRDAIVRRDGVDYHFVSHDDASLASSRFWGSNVTRTIRRLKPAVVHVDGLVFPLVVRHLRLTLPRRTSIVVQDHGGVPSVLDSFRDWPKRAFSRFGLGGADAFLFTARERSARRVCWRTRANLLASQRPVCD
jgi:hypothetical protein